MPAGIADEAGKSELIEPHEACAEEPAGRGTPWTGPVSRADHHSGFEEDNIRNTSTVDSAKFGASTVAVCQITSKLTEP